MTRNKYCGRKFIMQILCMSIVALGLFPINAWCLITYIHNQTDSQAIEALNKILKAVTTFSGSITIIAAESKKIENYAAGIAKNLDEFDKSVTDYYQEVDKWQDLTKPNLAYPSLIETLNTKLIKEDQAINSKFDLLNKGAILGKTPFLNTDALNNTADQYSQNNLTYATAIRDQSMCPNPAATLTKSQNNDSYGKLHQDSCLVIYNLRAYKKLLNTQIRTKHDLIDKTTKDIFKLPDNTMGDHNARKDALMSVQMLREKMMYEHKVRTEEIDTRIKIADRTRVYSGAAMVGGAPTNPGLTIAIAAFKTAATFALERNIPKTPYNQ